MSAYVAENELISVIVAGLAHLDRPGLYISMPSEFAKFDVGSTSGGTKVGAKLKNMNIRAVCSRYASDKPSDYSGYKHISVLPPNQIELYKALCTYLYQCSEGNVPKSKLFKQINQLKSDVACSYCDSVGRAY